MSEQGGDDRDLLQGSDVNQRAAERVEVDIQVDCRDEGNFLFASIRNLSELGIFVETRAPAPPGTRLKIDFVLPISGAKISASGVVVWTNAYREGQENLNPGMGIRFLDLNDTSRQKICDLIRRIAYLEVDEELKN